MVIQHMVKPAMHKGCISVHFCLAKEAFYSWIGRPMRTDEKLIYQRIRRVTINPRPRMKSSKQVKTWTKQNYTRKIWIRLGMLLDFLQNLKTCLFGQFSHFVKCFPGIFRDSISPLSSKYFFTVSNYCTRITCV